MTVPDTTDWQQWTVVSKEGVSIAAGSREIRLVFDAGTIQNGGNVDRFGSDDLPALRSRRDDDEVEALAADRPDDALGVRILPGGSWAVRTSVIPHASTVSRKEAARDANTPPPSLGLPT